MKTRLARYIIPLIAVAVAAWFVVRDRPDAHLSQKRPPLRISNGYWVGWFPLTIAKEKGFFAQQGVDVELVFNPDIYGVVSDFSAGKVDGMPWIMLDVVRILAKEPDARVVLYSGYTAGADVIIAQPEIEEISDLKGKKIAAKTGAMGEMLVGEMLTQHGLGLADVTLIDTGSDTDVVEFLKAGKIQAGHSWEPYVTQAVKAGKKRIFSSKETPRLFADFTVFRGAVLRERGDDIRAFLRAWFQTVEYWKAYPKEANELIAKALKIPEDDITLEGYTLFSLGDVQREFAPRNDPTSLAWLVKKHIDFLVEDGQLGRRPDVYKMFDSSYLPDVTPQPSL